ncbi:O-antigen ligase [Comamonas sp. NLF-1-9]|uniref:O-antigen ligase family protein n=1 Tax=Comamonas sp. NLF-1-9 TaxID=2853163 RepID=UPI001C454C21|nr:O-antigen ligase family protein [Comamonas sp. NLF-1-9]QXL83774.1 O-antigen ligase family protein [Comamonas sp. NLF-1-9]
MSQEGERRAAQLTALGVFLVPAPALLFPSGYSVGAVLLFLASLLSIGAWGRCRPSLAMRWWIASVVCMGLVWTMDINALRGWASADRPAKYLLVLPCFVQLCLYPAPAGVLRLGVAAGAIGGGSLALFQNLVERSPRVDGFMNAIQFGDLSMLLGCICALWLAIGGGRWRWQTRLLLAVAACLGVLGSVLSLSRGGWLAGVLSLPLWLWLLARGHSHRRMWRALAALSLMGLLIGWYQGPEVAQRWSIAIQEGDAYREGIPASINTSSGQRLEQWRLALEMGRDRPWLGWRGQYSAEKARRVQAGQADPTVLRFDHAHNEILDMFAKRGLVGVAALLFFYLVPLLVFWPRRPGSEARWPARDQGDFALRLAGLAIPVLYIGFGLTQVFFAHNSGNLFYLLMVTLFMTALQQRRAAGVSAPAAG